MGGANYRATCSAVDDPVSIGPSVRPGSRAGIIRCMASDHDRSSIGVGVLLALVALSFAGRFLPGPSTWGFHLHAYLPLAFTVVWLVLAVVVFLPQFQRRTGEFLEFVGQKGVSSALGPVVLAAIFGCAFAVLSERVYFLGDGYLIGELIEKGMPFRSFDNMDYLAHFQLYKSLRNPLDPEPVRSFEIYRWGAVLAGVLGTLLLSFLAALLDWKAWQKGLLILLFLFSGPAAMFYGYVESYGYLFVFMSAFLLSGVLVLQGRFPLWAASLFFGLAAFSHLTAAFGAPALLFLALAAPGSSRVRGLLLGLGPAVLVFLGSVAAHVATGYDHDFFRREFLEAKNTKSLWVPLTGPHGLLSIEHWRDLLNLGLLSLPVPLALVAIRARTILEGARLRLVQFLLVHAASVGVFLLLIDRKLGGARDWDLFAAHGFGIVLLAVWAIGDAVGGREGAGSRGVVPALARVALPAAFLLSVPWFLLLHLESASIARFTDIAAGFPAFPRAYAYEELGKYYRNHREVDLALEMYEHCVETFPGNGRFHVLLGSMYIQKAAIAQDETEKLSYLTQAEAAYREGARLQGSNPAPGTYVNLARSLALQDRWEEAVDAYGRASELNPSDADIWEDLGHALLRVRRLEDAIGAYSNAIALNPAQQVRRQLGAAYLGLGRFDEAEAVFRDGLRLGEEPKQLRYGIGASLVGRAERAIQRGEVPNLEGLAEAEQMLRSVVTADPSDKEAAALYQRLRQLSSNQLPASGQ